MLKQKLLIAGLILGGVFLVSGVLLTAPAPWGIAINDKSGECAGYWMGDEFVHYSLPSGWQEYYPDFEKGETTIATPYGTCNFDSEEECCKELNFPFVAANIGDKSTVINYPPDDEDENLDSTNEKHRNFDVEIEISRDASFLVKETIIHDFGTRQGHGIYRDIPVEYRTEGGKKTKIGLRILLVKDGDGNNLNYEESKTGDHIRIKIGQADTLITGVHTYAITYKVTDAILFFDDHDELYWNVTGTKWPYPILSASAQVTLPLEIGDDVIQVKCYAGKFGESGEDCTASVTGKNQAIFKTTKTLGQGEGLTIVTGIPKGVILGPPLWKKILKWIILLLTFVFLPLFTFIIIFGLWFKWGRDPRGRGATYARYEPPDSLSPGEIGTISDMKVDLKDISASIVNLAVRGYLKIKVLSRRNYEFTKVKDGGGIPSPHEKVLFDALFEKGDKATLVDLKGSFYKHLSAIKKALYNQLIQNKYLPNMPNKIKATYLTIGILTLFLLPILLLVFVGGILLIFSPNFNTFSLPLPGIISGVIIIIFSFFMPRRTRRGVAAYEGIVGFKDFLTVTEKERLKFHNPPDKTPELFEMFLPYAMALAVEKEWAKQFKDIYIEPPDWYVGADVKTFSALAMANALTRDLGTAISPPASHTYGSGSAASGGSGFSGGFSGGGFGGGGGGSW